MGNKRTILVYGNCISQITHSVYQDTTLALSNVREPESEEKPQKSLNEKQQVRKAS